MAYASPAVEIHETISTDSAKEMVASDDLNLIDDHKGEVLNRTSRCDCACGRGCWRCCHIDWLSAIDWFKQ